MSVVAVSHRDHDVRYATDVVSPRCGTARGRRCLRFPPYGNGPRSEAEWALDGLGLLAAAAKALSLAQAAARVPRRCSLRPKPCRPVKLPQRPRPRCEERPGGDPLWPRGPPRGPPPREPPTCEPPPGRRSPGRAPPGRRSPGRWGRCECTTAPATTPVASSSGAIGANGIL